MCSPPWQRNPMGRLKAIIRKEFLHVSRDRRTLIMIVMMPMIQLIIYGYAVQTDIKHISTVVFDEDRSPLSRRLVEALVESQYFDINYRVASPKEMRWLIDHGRAK